MLKKWLSRFLTATFVTTMVLGNGVSSIVKAEDAPKYLDSRLSVDERVNDLISRMTLDEKIGQMVQAERKTATTEDVKNYFLGSILSGGGSLPTPNTAESWANMVDGFQKAASETRLGIPILYGVDAVHGHNNVFGTTIFPHNIGLGASGDADIVKKIGQATAEEMRATGVTWTFAPTLGIPHNERWGRTYETFGESSALTAKLGEAYVKGLQGEDPSRTLKKNNTVIATAKHYIGEGLTTDGVNQGNAVISNLSETLKNELLPPYIAAINAGARSVMVSYNSINGEKCHGNVDLLSNVLKGQLGFKGIVVSDYEGIAQLSGTERDKIKQAVNAGIDMAMVPNSWRSFITNLKDLVEKNEVSQDRINDAVTRILKVKFEQGLFEDAYAQRDLLSTVGSQAHRDIARQAVRESLVLLKNDNDIVGKLKDKKNILVAGKSADDIGIQCGGWTITWQGAAGNTTTGTTILQGIKNTVGNDVKVTYNMRGRASADNDVAVVVIGEKPYAETDGDRSPDALKLDSDDLTTLKNIKDTNPNLPVVVVLVSGRPLTIADQIDDMDGLVEAWLPGSEGQGVADVLFGNYDFTGKLNITWPWYASDITSKNEDGKALFKFGYGLKKGQTAVLPQKPTQPDNSIAIPGKVEAEAYTSMYGIQSENTSDQGGGKNLGYIDGGDWMNYDVNVAQDGKYKVEFRVASPGGSTDGAQLFLGTKNLTKATVPDTGGWQNWKTVEGVANLKAGKQTLTFKAGNGNFNINWMNFTRIGDYEDTGNDNGGGQNPGTTPSGPVIKAGAVEVYMSSSEQSGSMSWYDAPKDLSNTLTKKDNLDITSQDDSKITDIKIDDSKKYQSFLGMGTSFEESTINNISKMSPEKRTEFLKKLVDPVDGAGMSLMRLTIGTADFTGREFYTYYDNVPGASGPDWYNTTGKGFSIQKDIDYNIVATIKEALKINPNLKLFSSPWTPPGWMKDQTSSSESYENNGKLIKGGKLSDAHIADAAMYYTRYLEEYAKLGIPIYAMTLQNEPGLQIDYPSCSMTPEQEQKLAIAIKADIAKSDVLKGKDIKIWAFDHNFDSGVSFASQAMNNDAGKAAIDGIAFHDYGGEPTAMTQVHDMFPGHSVNLTERSVWGTSGADRIIQYYRNYAESYNSWVTMLDSNISPEQWTGTPDPTMFVLDANDHNNYWATPEYYITGQFSKFIKPGAVRIDSNYGSKDTVTNVVFKNPDGSLVAVVVNQTENAQSFKLTSSGAQITATIPAKNVATYKWNPIAAEKINKLPGTFSSANFTDASSNIKVEGDHVGYIHDGNYLDYYVNVDEAGLYNMTFETATPWGNYDDGAKKNRQIHVMLGDKELTNVFVQQSAWDNSTWSNYFTVKNTINFTSKGLQKIRFNIDAGEFNIKNIKVEKAVSIYNLPGRIEGKNYINSKGVVIQDDKLGFVDKDDFMEYKVNVAEDGEYTLNLNIASANSAPTFDLYSDSDLVKTVNLQGTDDWSKWQVQSTRINLTKGEHTLKFLVKSGFNLDWFTVGSAIGVTNNVINEGQEEGSVINVNLYDGKFADTLTKANWKLENLPAGIDYEVTRVNDTAAKITLHGSSSLDFDYDKTINVLMAAKEVAGLSDKTYNIGSSFIITANPDVEKIAATDAIPMNTSSVDVTLTGGTFNKDKLGDITLSGDAAEGKYVQLVSATYLDATHVRLNLKWGALYYEDLPLVVNIPASAYSDSTNDNTLTTTIKCQKSDQKPTPYKVSDKEITLTEDMAYRAKGSLKSDVQTGNRIDYYLDVPEAGDYTITYTAYNNSAITNAIKLSVGQDTNVAGNIATLSFAKFWGGTLSVKDTVRLEAGTQTLRIEVVNGGFTLNSIKIVKKQAPQEIKADNSGDTTVINADSLFGGSRDKGYAIETKDGVKNIGDTVVGSYMDYSVNVKKAGIYKVTYNYADSVSSVPVAILEDSQGKELGKTKMPSTGDWNKWANSDSTPVYLQAGVQNLRVYVDVDGFNIRSLTLKYTNDSTAPTIYGNDAVIQQGEKPDLIKALGLSVVDDMDGDITSKVTLDDSKLDINKAGTYEVVASVSDISGNKAEKSFKVTVKEDAIAPVIEGHNAVIPVGATFDPVKDLALKITDNKDGDVTAKAVITHVVDTSKDGVFRVKVAITDAAGNSSVSFFIVRVLSMGAIDTNDLTINVGDKFNPLDGVKAIDINGDDLTSKLEVVSNNVDTTKAGTYKVVYKVVDREGNVINKERIITVKEVPQQPGDNGNNPGNGGNNPGDNGNNPGNGGNNNPGDNGNSGNGGNNPGNGNSNGGQNNQTGTVITDENGKKIIQVSKISNGNNVIEIKDVSKGFTLEVTDTAAIKNGNGSIEVKGANIDAVVPFSVISKSLLKDGSRVVVNLTIEEGNDITKNIKGIKKVYNFGLSVVTGDSKVDIHNFADGKAQISLILTDEELKGLDKNNIAVFYYNESTKKFEIMDTKVEGNKVTFTTPHFSKFIVAEKAATGEQVLPKTGSTVDSNILLILGLMMLTIGAGVLVRKRSVK
ncbi:glycoside hydrolase family 3 N-terminal domain-containing protein [Clostridium fungisolvens]|uniref:beta-glucosidase n=1 Tax=Clostridium fungisolvens TaxID=1604897 RepID=A0A6V8SKD0_9CLOT|nr:glycoside hydrolase family 3 N-terminal domain-containing protein [Clostridium fungisolvens]GFP77684.1 Beta-hexosaminidase [Clostridium fungisolvens]